MVVVRNRARFYANFGAHASLVGELQGDLFDPLRQGPVAMENPGSVQSARSRRFVSDPLRSFVSRLARIIMVAVPASFPQC